MKSKKIIVLAILLVIAIAIIALKKTNHNIRQEQEVTSSALFRISSSQNPPNNLYANDPGYKEIYDISDPLFPGTISMKNDGETNDSYKIIAFVNYRQVMFSVENKQNFVHQINLKSSRKTIKRFEMPVSKGSNIVAILALRTKANGKFNRNYHPETFVISQRFLVNYANKDQVKDFPFKKISTKHYKKTEKSIEPLIILSKPKHVVGSFDFSLIKKPKQVGIIALTNFRQIGSYIIPVDYKTSTFYLPKINKKGLYFVIAFTDPLNNSLEALRSSSILQSNWLYN